jgi:two-component system, NtrC family, response regulator HydG
MGAPVKPAPTPEIAPTVRRSPVNGDEETVATFTLEVVEGPDAGRSFTLDASSPTRVLIGTSPVCTMRLVDPEVSRRHAAMTFQSGRIQFIDLESTNGTTVNGVIVNEARLSGGEAIRMGSSVLTLQRGESKASDLGTATSFGRVEGASVPMRRLYPMLEALANADGVVLIEGERGTGKELLAEELHRSSKRAEAPFVTLDASTLPTDQLNAKLFGSPESPSIVESARGGVLFVDEIGNLSRAVQKRVSSFVKSNGVRLIAATTRDLDRDVTSGRFDESFFFELATGRVELPPLRQRDGDIPVLARRFWAEFARPVSDAVPPFPVDLLPRFEHYPWPGNVRELRSVVIQRVTFGEVSRSFLAESAVAEGRDIMAAVIQEQLPFPNARDRIVREFERRYVEAALAQHGGNVGAAARASGIAQRYFQIVRARHR